MLPEWTIVLINAKGEEQFRKRYRSDYTEVLEKARQLLEEYKEFLDVVDFEIH